MGSSRFSWAAEEPESPLCTSAASLILPSCCFLAPTSLHAPAQEHLPPSHLRPLTTCPHGLCHLKDVEARVQGHTRKALFSLVPSSSPGGLKQQVCVHVKLRLTLAESLPQDHQRSEGQRELLGPMCLYRQVGLRLTLSTVL